jgi:hypothetical protein
VQPARTEGTVLPPGRVLDGGCGEGRGRDPGPTEVSVGALPDGTLLCFWTHPSGGQRVDFARTGLDHVSFTVDSLEELSEWEHKPGRVWAQARHRAVNIGTRKSRWTVVRKRPVLPERATCRGDQRCPTTRQPARKRTGPGERR